MVCPSGIKRGKHCMSEEQILAHAKNYLIENDKTKCPEGHHLSRDLKCISSVTCGPGTSLDDSHRCVPNMCEIGKKMDRDGLCSLDAHTCGAGTTLVKNKCVPIQCDVGKYWNGTTCAFHPALCGVGTTRAELGDGRHICVGETTTTGDGVQNKD